MKLPQILHRKILILKVYLERDRPTASTLYILWQGHAKNLLFLLLAINCEPLM